VLENGKLGVQVSDRFPVPDQMDIELNCSEYQTPGSGDEGEDPYLDL